MTDISAVLSIYPEHIRTLLEEIFFKLETYDLVTDHVHQLWKRCGFTTGPNISQTSHVGSRLDKLFLREAGVYSKDPSGSLPSRGELEEYEKERVLLKQYINDYALDKEKLRLKQDELKKFTDILDTWDEMKDKEEKVREFMEKLIDLYEEYVDVIMEYLPGRTFVNRL